MACLLLAGCNQNPYLAAQPAPAWQQSPAPATAQMQDLNRRATALDADNRDLHTELARVEQERQLLTDEVALLKQRLNETNEQLREAQLASQQASEKIKTFEASTRRRGSATITANNSLRDSLRVADIPGFEVRQDEDVVRIEVPADRLFHARTAQLLPSANYLLDSLAQSIKQYYPNQMVGIEGHTDSSTAGTTSNHQLAASQASAVLQALTSRHRIPSEQLFLVSHGANHPRVSNGTPSGRSKNRRIELVVYPQTYRRT